MLPSNLSKFCPECGTAVKEDGAVEGLGSEGRSDLPQSDESAGGAGLHALLDGDRAKWIAGLAAILLAVSVWAIAGSGGDEAESSGPESVARTVSAVDRCIDETLMFLNETADAENAGDEMFIFRRYGAEDPRTRELLNIYTTFQAEIYRVGEEEANRLHFERVASYCENSATDEYGNPLNWEPID